MAEHVGGIAGSGAGGIGQTLVVVGGRSRRVAPVGTAVNLIDIFKGDSRFRLGDSLGIEQIEVGQADYRVVGPDDMFRADSGPSRLVNLRGAK